MEFAIKKNKVKKKYYLKIYLEFFKTMVKKRKLFRKKTIYTFKSAISTNWIKDRIFLAGDAAHLSPPFMGQGMCAGIRDVSNLAWKISKCLKSKHTEKLLSSYQSERFTNVKEYVETTMRMGEFVNAAESIEITDNISSGSDGVVYVYKASFRKGLGSISDINRGKIFPQLKLKNGKSLDDFFSCSLILILSNELKNKKKLSKLPTIIENEVKGLSEVLKDYKSKAIIVRPDRFVLQSCATIKSFSKFIKYFNKF